MESSVTSILPPIVILIVGFYTRKILLSLSCGVLVAAFIVSGYDPFLTLQYAARKLSTTLEIATLTNPATFWQSWNAFICFFLLCLGVFISLIHHSGGAFAYERFIKRHLRKRKHVETSSLLLSTGLFIDDYFSSLTVGSVMHPITDAYRIPRAKLAFLVDAMAAPVTILCPVSSWVAAIVGFLRDNGVQNEAGQGVQVIGSPFLAYLNILPFLFYSFVVIVGAWFIVLRGLSFGLMGVHEQVAIKTGNVFNGKESPFPVVKPEKVCANEDNVGLRDFFIPVAILIASIFCGILHSGDSRLFGGQHGLADALRHAAAAKGLFLGGSGALILAGIYYLLRRKLHPRDCPQLLRSGVMLMAPATMVLMLAWTLGGMLRHDLGTGYYLAGLLTSSLPEQFIPVMFFVVSLVTSFAIGSTWGTAAVMFPIAIQMIVGMGSLEAPVLMSQLPLLFPALGAILSGSIAGNHISPISDTTIMSATSTAMLHSDHIETQLGYALPLIAVTACSFLCLGYLVEFGTGVAFAVTLPLTLLMVAMVLTHLQQRDHYKSQALSQAKL